MSLIVSVIEKTGVNDYLRTDVENDIVNNLVTETSMFFNIKKANEKHV